MLDARGQKKLPQNLVSPCVVRIVVVCSWIHIPDIKVHGANMGPTWVLSAPDGPHIGPMNFDIRGAPFGKALYMAELASYCWTSTIRFRDILLSFQTKYLINQNVHARSKWKQYTLFVKFGKHFLFDNYCKCTPRQRIQFPFHSYWGTHISIMEAQVSPKYQLFACLLNRVFIRKQRKYQCSYLHALLGGGGGSAVDQYNIYPPVTYLHCHIIETINPWQYLSHNISIEYTCVRLRPV